MNTYNINKIHGDLISQFYGSEIKIEEKSRQDFGNYFEISIIKEGKEVNMIITKYEVEKEDFNWFYSPNPLNKSIPLVERHSNIDNLTNDIKDIFDKNRFSEDYLKELNK